MTTPNPEGGAPPGPPGDLGRTRGWHRPVWLIVLAALGLAVPLVAYGWFVGHFGVNALYADDWSDVGLISRAYGGTLGFAQLWAVHGENRILFPNLIVLLLAYTTRFNVVVEEWISAAMLAAATVLFILAHRRRAPDIPWIAYCPVAILMLSFSQGRNAIWGFQMAWYVVIAALAATLFLLDRPELGRVALAGAIVTGVIGSFSSLQGLLVWPSGLVLLWLCGRTRKVIVSWLVAAVVTTVVYFINFQFPPGNLAYVLSHPVDGVLFYFFAVGDVVGLQAPSGNHPGNGAVIALGVLICAIAVWTVVMYCRRRDASEAGRVGVAVIVFGLLFAGVITVSRATFGPSVALRYDPFDLLTLVGCYLALMGPVAAAPAFGWGRKAMLAARSLLAVVICGQVVLSILWGVSNARIWHQTQIDAADVTANLAKAPGPLVVSALFPSPDVGPGYLRGLAAVAASHRLSLFGTNAAAADRARGLLIDRSAPVCTVVRPQAGATVGGATVLVAEASAPADMSNVHLDFGVAKVEFSLTGGGGRSTGSDGGRVVIAAADTPYGWIARWESRSVANGTYELRAVAFGSNGLSTESAGVGVDVANGAAGRSPGPPRAVGAVQAGGLSTVRKVKGRSPILTSTDATARPSGARLSSSRAGSSSVASSS